MELVKNNSDQNTEFVQILRLITDSRSHTFAKANAEMIMLYFNIGKVVCEKVSSGNWGEKTVQELADYIAMKQPELRGFTRRGLYRMRQFYDTYSNHQFVTTVSTQLQITDNEVSDFISTLLSQIQWSAHLHILSKTKTAEEKLFYLNLILEQNLSVRELERQLNTAVYERTMLSNKQLGKISDRVPQNIFKDPFVFEFLNLPESHSENEFEKAITQNLQKFILEVGKGFTYI
jgi:hypothetical protein